MKIKRIFKEGTYEYEHHENLEVSDVSEMLSKAGKIVKFKGSIWSWQMYDTSKDPSIDYELIYTPASPYEKDRGVDREISDHYSLQRIGFGCECGAEKTGQPGHSYWCTKYRRF